jgi:hypothetical protein
MSLDVLWSPRDWAHAIAALPAAGPVPSRCVLVPREAVAHALRRELLRADLGRALAGTRFVPTAAAAVEVLRAAGTDFRPGEDGLRPARLHALFRTGLRLRHFTPALLRDKPGWDAAFARAVGDLEAAGLQPDDLERAGATDSLRDVALIWRTVQDAAGGSWTLPLVYLGAARLLAREPGAWPFPQPVLAATSLGATTAVARFLRAIPGVRLAVLGGRLAEAVEDVERALEALRREGLFRPPGPDLQLEYALAGPWDDGLLLSGYADLVAATADGFDVLDFKTDAPPGAAVEVGHAEYVAQVRAYGHLLQGGGITGARRLRCGLLFTADGSVHWIVR